VLSVSPETMATMARIAALIGFAIAGTAGATSAADVPQDATVRAHLDVLADADCTTFASVVARVAERSQRIAFVGAAAGVPALRGKIGRIAGGSVLAELTVVQPSGRQSSRQLAAPTCEEAAEALALLVAMTLDPAVALHVQSEPQGAGSTGSVGSAANNSTSAASTAGAKSTQDGSGPRHDGAAATPPDEASRAPSEKPGDSTLVASEADTSSLPAVRSGSFGLLGAGMTGPAPRAMFGLGLYGFIAFDRASPLSLAMRVTAAHDWRNGLPEAGGIADFSLDVAGLDLCALRLSAGPFTSRLCAAGRLGRLAASGSDTYNAQSQVRLFASAGGAALVMVALPAALELVADAELQWALTRDEFAFNPQVFYQTQPITLTLGLGVGRHFW